MTLESLILLGMEFGLQRIEKSVVSAQMAQWRSEGKSDEQIGALLKETFANEVAAAKADSARAKAEGR